MNDQLNMGELIKAIYTKTRSAPGSDVITNKTLRNTLEEPKQKPLDKYNRVWEGGGLQRVWKHSWVTPLHKPGKRLDHIDNLKPVSPTSNICKTMKKIVLGRTRGITERHERLDPLQTGFREAMGT